MSTHNYIRLNFKLIKTFQNKLLPFNILILKILTQTILVLKYLVKNVKIFKEKKINGRSVF